MASSIPSHEQIESILQEDLRRFFETGSAKGLTATVSRLRSSSHAA